MNLNQFPNVHFFITSKGFPPFVLFIKIWKERSLKVSMFLSNIA